MKRREFIGLIAGAAAWPLTVSAQRRLPVLGFLHVGSASVFAHVTAAIRRGLADADYFDGRNVEIEYRWADGQLDRVPRLAADLLRLQPAVIIAVRHGAQALKAISTTTPIVFISAEDPIKLGFIDSLNRPGGNMTGVYMFNSEVEAKRLGLLRDAFPAATAIGVLVHRDYSLADVQVRDVQEAAVRLGVRVFIQRSNPGDDLEGAFALMVQQGASALLICASPFFSDQRDRLVRLAARHRLPSVSEWREYALAGGLMSYGNSITDNYRQLGIYAGRILKGATPADLPVVQPTKFEFVLNLKTAKTLGVHVSENLLTLADEVSE
jgi:putative tryptophan/tyrosine transport system substrate-binding protein